MQLIQYIHKVSLYIFCVKKLINNGEYMFSKNDIWNQRL